MPALVNPFRFRLANPEAADAVSTFELGATQTQNSLDWWNGATADINTGVANVNAACRWKNHHICSFGCGSPEETIGVFDWAGACDERIPGSPAANHTWGDPDHLTLTMAMAPSWMCGGTSGVTNWDNINSVAPTSGHFADFADLCGRAITRYTLCEAVHVWNELKGFYNNTLNRADYEGYTTMYNAVYSAVKTARSTVAVGGPYTVIYVTGGATTTELSGPWGYVAQETLDTIKYWLANKTGADFIALDGGNMTADNTGLVTPMVAAETLVPALVAWIRNLNPTTYPGADTLPIVFAEWYIWGAHWLATQPSHAQTAATWMVGTLAALRAGVTRAFLWEPMGDTNGDLAPYSPMGLVTDTRVASGGDPTELQAAAVIIHDWFSTGALLYDIDPGNANIYALGTSTKAVLVNKTGSSQSTSGFPTPTTLAGWEIKLVDWTPTSTPGGGTQDLSGTAAGTSSTTAALTVSGTETWTGSNGASWPAPWVTSAGGAGNLVDIQSNKGRQRTDSTAFTYNGARAYRGATTVTDIDITVTFSFDVGGESYGSFHCRGDSWSGTSDHFANGYQFYMDVASSSMNIVKYVSGAQAWLAGGSVSVSAATDYKMRVQAAGTTLQVKVWLASSSEPGSWLATVTDSSFTAGHWALTAGSGAVTSVNWSWDNLSWSV